MQAGFSISHSQYPILLPTNFPQNQKPKLMVAASSHLSPRPSTSAPIKAAAATLSYEPSTVDYTSLISVFPAEACETIGGEACLYGDVYPEVKLERVATNEPTLTASESIERDYLHYNDAKTVFCAEACDDLGGEFCGRDYQRGVY